MKTTLPKKTGVLLTNLGTPEAPTAVAVRPYLRQFLSDPRVVEIPPLLWKPILNLFILTTRPKKSAEKYAKIWTKHGAPLRVYTQLQAKLLQGRFVHAKLPNVMVASAMRYGEPSIEKALNSLREKGCERILVLPLYPQYAASTTASTFDEVARVLKTWRNQPQMTFVRSFGEHPLYIHALAESVRKSWGENGRPERLVMSFHGAPKFSYDKGDPYYDECLSTGKLLAQELGLSQEQYLITFQSRFGRAQWLQPYTQPTLESLAKSGVSKVALICPGFVSDCLETLEEIAMEAKASYLAAGGREFHYIPCLNQQDALIQMLLEVCREHMTFVERSDA